MARKARIVRLSVAWFLATAASAWAQEAASSLDVLVGRLEIGQRLWVTDATGREVRGRLERLSSETLVLDANGIKTFDASDIRRVRVRTRDSLGNGTLVGLGVGAVMGTAWCIGAIADDSGELDARVECAEGATVFPALGALIGLAVDAVIPGRLRVVYEATAPEGASRVRLMVVPWVSSRAKGLAVSLAF